MRLRTPRWELHWPWWVKKTILCATWGDRGTLFFSSGVTPGRFDRHKNLKHIFAGGDEARQLDYGRRGGNCIGRGGLEGDFACGLQGYYGKYVFQLWSDKGAFLLGI